MTRWAYGYNMMGWGWLAGVIDVAPNIIAIIVVLHLVPGRVNHAAISGSAWSLRPGGNPLRPFTYTPRGYIVTA